MRRLLTPLFALILLAPTMANAGPATTADPVRIAVIDTGIDATHPEFGAGQIVAWKDFTPEASPTPMDGHGHGTATASLVAGLNNGNCGTGLANQKLSFSPGADLIIARVGDNGGSISGSITNAVRWAIQQEADVISMSIGSIIPFPINSNLMMEARDAGILVVVSAGNGAGNAGLAPYPGWTSNYGNHPGTLVVGGADRNGGTATSTTGNMDPDIVSWSDSVCVARANTDTYGKMSGTSFSAPLVAGIAGSAITSARSTGADDTPDRIERVLLTSAYNNPLQPYAREGMGFILTNQMNKINTHAAAGTLQDYDAQGPWAQADRVYHDNAIVLAKNLQ